MDFKIKYMQHPTSQQCYAVAETFIKALEIYPDVELNMDEPKVNNDGHSCGTVHCHAGLYAVMKCDLTNKIKYIDGAFQMAIDLGFENHYFLKEWADLHPDIWGNRWGGAMFTDSWSFRGEGREDGAKNVQDIADHWREVGDRLKALETHKL